MRVVLLVSLLFFTSLFAFTQDKPETETVQYSKKGHMYFYWGWNRGWFSNSNITFSGADYDFELNDVVAKDRQSTFGLDPHLNPANATIPQYNFRIGYFFTDHWDASFGIDHMKYVMQADQTVKISGKIDNSGTPYDGSYDNDDFVLTRDFLQFEHTDGLNYPNLSIRRFDEIFGFKKVTINLTEGFGVGALYPRTNTTLLNNERYDEFHWSGYGMDLTVGLNVTFWKVFFIQSEFKGGYINMQDIRTTNSSSDKASQDFFFSQLNILFGGVININGKSNK